MPRCNSATATLFVGPAIGLALWAVIVCAFVWPIGTAIVAAWVGWGALLAVAGRLLFAGLRTAELEMR